MQIQLKEIQESDLEYIKEIYNYYTLNSTVVYFLSPVSTEDLRTFIPLHDPLYRAYIIYNTTGERCGFCYYNKFKPREAYRISVEVTVYLHPDYTGCGYGKEALNAIETIIRENGFSNIIALIDDENYSSIHLFERAGYHCCGHLQEVAEKFGKKLGVKFYQKRI